MTFATSPLEPALFRRTAGAAGNLLLAMAVMLCIPLAALAVGIPIALFVRLVFWIGESL